MSVNLLEKGSRLCEQSMALLEISESLLRRCDEQLARCRRMLQDRTKRRASESLLPVIRLKLHDGQLPHDSSSILVGHPGEGGQCAACNKALLKGQLVMDIPSTDGAVVHLHAGCYMVWNAERHKTRQ